MKIENQQGASSGCQRTLTTRRKTVKIKRNDNQETKHGSSHKDLSNVHYLFI